MYRWYQVFNRTELDAQNVPYLEKQVEFKQDGEQTVRLYKGQYYSLVVGDVFLPVNLNGRNPFVQPAEKTAAYMDAAGNIWVGFYAG